LIDIGVTDIFGFPACRNVVKNISVNMPKKIASDFCFIGLSLLSIMGSKRFEFFHKKGVGNDQLPQGIALIGIIRAMAD